MTLDRNEQDTAVKGHFFLLLFFLDNNSEKW